MTTTTETLDKLVDELDLGKGTDLFGKDGLVKQITKRLVERALEAEMEEHLGYPKGERDAQPRDNTRNGSSSKKVKLADGALELEVPRDREGSFAPQLVRKRQTRLTGFDDTVLSLYSRGMSTRDIQGHLSELYGTEVSPDLISRASALVRIDPLVLARTDPPAESSANG